MRVTVAFPKELYVNVRKDLLLKVKGDVWTKVGGGDFDIKNDKELTTPIYFQANLLGNVDVKSKKNFRVLLLPAEMIEPFFPFLVQYLGEDYFELLKSFNKMGAREILVIEEAGVYPKYTLIPLKLEDGVPLYVKGSRFDVPKSVAINSLKAYETPEKGLDLILQGLIKGLTLAILAQFSYEDIDLNFALKVLKAKGIEGIPIFDPQAGSGKILSLLIDKYRLKKSLLAGFELREMEPQNERNRVLYGVDYKFFEPFYPSLGENFVFFINPPYNEDYKDIRKTLDLIPEYAWFPVIGILPADAIRHLEDFYGTAIKVPKEMIGYEDDRVPQTLCVFVASKRRAKHITVKEAKSEEDLVRYIAEEVGRRLSHLVSINPSGAKVKELFSNAGTKWSRLLRKFNSYKRDVEVIEKFFEKEGLSLFKKFSADDIVLSGERVFPDTRLFNSLEKRSLKEVLSSLPILTFYRDAYPKLFNLVKHYAEKAGYDFPSLADRGSKILSTMDDIGVLKLSAYPRVLNITENRPIIKEIISTMVKDLPISNEKKKEIELAVNLGLEKCDKIVIKAVQEAKDFETEVGVGYTSALVFVNSVGRDMFALSLPLKEFYSLLEEKGVISLKDKYEVVKPTRDFKKKLLTVFVHGALENLEFYDIKEEQAKMIRETKKLDRKTIVNFLVSTNLTNKLKEKLIEAYQVESLLEESISSLLKSRKINVSGVKDLIDAVTTLYKESPKEFITSPDKDKILKDLIGDYLKEVPESLKEDIKESILRALAEHYFVLDTIRTSAIKLVHTFKAAFEIEKLLEKDRVDEAWRLFEKLFLQSLRVKPHQFKEAVRFLAKYDMNKEGGHLLGWEMRSGKTLVMLMISYFGGMLLNKDAYFFPKTANLNDIILQSFTFLPFLLNKIYAYRSGEVSPILQEGRVSTLYTDDIFPNLYGILSSARGRDVKRFVVGGGEKIEKLLSTYTKEMEELIKRAEKFLAEGREIKTAANSPFAFVLELAGYSDAVKLAFYWYLERHKGDFDLSVLPAVKRVLVNHFERISELEEERKTLDGNVSNKIHIVPKSQLIGVSYKIPQEEKIVYDDKTATVKTDKDFLADMEVVTQSNFLESDIGIYSPYDDYIVTDMDYVSVKEKADYFFEKEIYETGEDFSEEEIEELYRTLKINHVELFRLNGVPYYGVKFSFDTDKVPEEVKRLASTLLEQKVLERSYYRYRSVYMLYLESALKRDPIKSLPFSENLPEKVSVNATFRHLKGSRIPVSLKINKELLSNEITYLNLKVETINDENPLEAHKRDAKVKELTFTVKAKSKRRKPIVEFFVKGEDGEPGILITSDSNARQYFVNSRVFENFGGIMVVDEVDEASEPSAATYKSLFYIAKNSALRIAATGTPTSGYPETFVALLGLVADMPYTAVKKSMMEVKEDFSIYSIKDKGPSGVLLSLLYVFRELDNNSRSIFLKELKEILVQEDASYVGYEIMKLIEKNSESETIKNILEKIRGNTFEQDIGYYFLRMRNDLLSATKETLQEVIFNAIKRMGTREPGTFDPIGYISSLNVAGASYSLNSRDKLKGTKEKLVFDEPIVIEGEVDEEEELEQLFAEDSLLVRLKHDIDFGGVKRSYLLPKSVTLVFENFAKYLEVVKKNPEKVVKALKEKGLDLTKKDVKTLISSSGKTTSDDILSLFKSYLINSYTFPSVQDAEVKEKLLFTLVEDFVTAFLYRKDKEIYSLTEAITELNLRSNKNENDEDAQLKTKLGYSFTPLLYIPFSPDTGSVDVALDKKGNLYLNGEGPVRLTKKVPLVRESWKPLFKNEEYAYIEFNYRLTSENDFEIVDAFTNAGYQDRIRENVVNRKNFLVSSHRVLSLAVGLLDVLAELYHNKDNETQTHILLRVNDNRIKEILRRIDTEKLEKRGIYLKTFTNNPELDIESKKIKRTLKAEEREGKRRTQLIVVSSDETIARGVDLSHLDEMIVIGASPSGKTATQLFARLFDADNKNEGSVFVYGKPLKISKYRDKIYLGLNETYNRIRKLLSKYEFIKAITTAELVNIANLTSERILRLTGEFEQDLENAKLKISNIYSLDI